MYKKTSIIFLTLLLPLTTLADQTAIKSYRDAKKPFWETLYPSGYSIYCGQYFDNRSATTNGQHLSIEHVYPRAWMRDSLQCGNDRDCRKNVPRYGLMAGDLHNLYPALKSVNSSRGKAPYGEIPNEIWRYDNCDYERSQGIAEPRPIARGNLARAIFYMHAEYDLKLDREDALILQQWNRDDPPSCPEMKRNNIVEEIQGNRNRYIDHPHWVDRLPIFFQ